MIFFLSDSRFKKCIPKHWKLYELRLPRKEDCMSVIYYIGDNRLTFQEFQQDALSLPAYIETIWNFTENELIVLMVHSTVQKRGFATLLLFISMITAGEEGIDNITLEDNSDNYRKKNNIYLKIGLRYEDKNDPKMVCSTWDIMRMWNIIKKKYNWIV